MILELAELNATEDGRGGMSTHQKLKTALPCELRSSVIQRHQSWQKDVPWLGLVPK